MSLVKGLDGLKQADIIQYTTLRGRLLKTGWSVNPADAVLFARGEWYRIRHVEDFMVSGPTEKAVEDAKATLSSRFPVKDFVRVSFVLSLHVTQAGQGYLLGQAGFIRKLVERHVSSVKERTTNLPASTYQHSNQDVQCTDSHQYMQAVGELLFAST